MAGHQEGAHHVLGSGETSLGRPGVPNDRILCGPCSSAETLQQQRVRHLGHWVARLRALPGFVHGLHQLRILAAGSAPFIVNLTLTRTVQGTATPFTVFGVNDAVEEDILCAA